MSLLKYIEYYIFLEPVAVLFYIAAQFNYKNRETMTCIRKILPNVKDFKAFWKEKGPFAYALTSREYPPVLLEPEEWIFGNDKIAVLKELMQFSQSKMAFVRAPFNPDNKSILRPQDICAWKITHFPEDWNQIVCDAFVPEGHLTRAVTDDIEARGGEDNKEEVEKAFFSLILRQLDEMGYVLLCPRGKSKSAGIRSYLEEWEEDEADAGFL